MKSTVRTGMVWGVAAASAAGLLALQTPMNAEAGTGLAPSTLWGVDHSDGQLFAVIGAEGSSDGTAVDYGALRVLRGERLEAIGKGIDGLAIVSDRAAVLSYNGDIDDTRGPVLLGVDIGRVSRLGGNTARVMGSLHPAEHTTGVGSYVGAAVKDYTARVGGLAGDPLFDDLYAAITLESDTASVQVLYSMTRDVRGDLVMHEVGPIRGGTADTIEDMSFAPDGMLYITGATTLRTVEPSTGRVVHERPLAMGDGASARMSGGASWDLIEDRLAVAGGSTLTIADRDGTEARTIDLAAIGVDDAGALDYAIDRNPEIAAGSMGAFGRGDAVGNLPTAGGSSGSAAELAGDVHTGLLGSGFGAMFDRVTGNGGFMPGSATGAGPGRALVMGNAAFSGSAGGGGGGGSRLASALTGPDADPLESEPGKTPETDGGSDDSGDQVLTPAPGTVAVLLGAAGAVSTRRRRS